MLPQPLLGANAFELRVCEDLLDEMDIHEEALTLALRVRRHQSDANTGNLRSSAQITAQIDPRSASPSDGSFGSDMPIPHVHVHVYTTCRNGAFLQLRAWLCACSVWLCGCARARRGTYTYST
jgi:hypothetical protein